MHFTHINDGTGGKAGKFAVLADANGCAKPGYPVNALSLCRFKPAMSNGMAEAGWAQIAYAWTLE
ncbi:MAG: hypothetical protein ACREWI_17160 [Telluria sp.]